MYRDVFQVSDVILDLRHVYVGEPGSERLTMTQEFGEWDVVELEILSY